MKRIWMTVAVCGVGAILSNPGGAEAAGFAIKEQSTTSMGNAFAGATAEAADISYMFFNPAGLTRHDGHQVSVGASYIAPQAKPEAMQGTRAMALGGTTISGGNGGDDVSADAVVPVFYGMVSVDKDLKIGLGVNAPFGLRTEYEDGWTGRYHALDSELKTINANPTVAYRALDWLSLGVGLQVQYADAELSNAVDFATIGNAPGNADGFGEVTGDDFGYGFTLGLLIEPTETTRFGLGFRSQVAHELAGDAEFSGGGAVRQAFAARGAFADTGAKAKLRTPDTASFGAYHEINEAWAVMGEVQWTNWSDFETLRIRFDNNTPDSVTEEQWDDSWFGAVGVTYRPRADIALRLGMAYDESPIPDATRTPRIPGGDRTWIAIGANWSPTPYLSFDAGYTHIFVEDTSISLDTSDPNNRSRGNLDGRYETAIDIISVQATLRF